MRDRVFSEWMNEKGSGQEVKKTKTVKPVLSGQP